MSGVRSIDLSCFDADRHSDTGHLSKAIVDTKKAEHLTYFHSLFYVKEPSLKKSEIFGDTDQIGYINLAPISHFESTGAVFIVKSLLFPTWVVVY